MSSTLITLGLVVFVAVINLAIGAALAVLLGRGPLAWRERYGVRWRYRLEQWTSSRPQRSV